MSVLSDAEMLSALDSVATAAGLGVGRPIEASAVAGLSGPFVTREVSGPDGGLEVCVAVRDRMSEGAEELCHALTTAVTDGEAGAEGTPVATGADLAARFVSPFEVVALVDGADVHALVLRTVDRRKGGGAAHGSGGGPAPVNQALAGAAGGFDKLINVALDVSVELGRTSVTLSDVLAYDVGSVVELDRAAGSPVDIRVNGTLLAHGEVVLIDDEYAVRITSIVEPGSQP